MFGTYCEISRSQIISMKNSISTHQIEFSLNSNSSNNYLRYAYPGGHMRKPKPTRSLISDKYLAMLHKKDTPTPKPIKMKQSPIKKPSPNETSEMVLPNIHIGIGKEPSFSYSTKEETDTMIRYFSAAGRRIHALFPKPKPTSSRLVARSTPLISPLDCYLEVVSISRWKLFVEEPQQVTAYYRIIEEITIREQNLRNCSELAKAIDATYWEYALHRIELFERKQAVGIKLDSECDIIIARQKELAIALAHLRYATAKVLHAIAKLRALVQPKLDANAVVSFFWQEQNYILKLSSDTREILELPTMVLWLGLDRGSNPLLIPPSQHIPKAIWKSGMRKYESWVRGYLAANHVDNSEDSAQLFFGNHSVGRFTSSDVTESTAANDCSGDRGATGSSDGPLSLSTSLPIESSHVGSKSPARVRGIIRTALLVDNNGDVCNGSKQLKKQRGKRKKCVLYVYTQEGNIDVGNNENSEQRASDREVSYDGEDDIEESEEDKSLQQIEAVDDNSSKLLVGSYAQAEISDSGRGVGERIPLPQESSPDIKVKNVLITHLNEEKDSALLAECALPEKRMTMSVSLGIISDADFDNDKWSMSSFVAYDAPVTIPHTPRILTPLPPAPAFELETVSQDTLETYQQWQSSGEDFAVIADILRGINECDGGGEGVFKQDDSPKLDQPSQMNAVHEGSESLQKVSTKLSQKKDPYSNNAKKLLVMWNFFFSSTVTPEVSPSASSLFWEDYSHIPPFVEAAVGFEAVFPESDIIPQIAQPLRVELESLNNIITLEVKLQDEVTDKREATSRQKEAFMTMVESSSLKYVDQDAATTNSSVINLFERINPAELLPRQGGIGSSASANLLASDPKIFSLTNSLSHLDSMNPKGTAKARFEDSSSIKAKHASLLKVRKSCLGSPNFAAKGYTNKGRVKKLPLLFSDDGSKITFIRDPNSGKLVSNILIFKKAGAVLIQSIIRGFLARKYYQRLKKHERERNAGLVILYSYLCYKARRAYAVAKRQFYIKSVVCRRFLLQRKGKVTGVIQSFIKRFSKVRCEFQKRKKLAERATQEEQRRTQREVEAMIERQQEGDTMRIASKNPSSRHAYRLSVSLPGLIDTSSPMSRRGTLAYDNNEPANSIGGSASSNSNRGSMYASPPSPGPIIPPVKDGGGGRRWSIASPNTVSTIHLQHSESAQSHPSIGGTRNISFGRLESDDGPVAFDETSFDTLSPNKFFLSDARVDSERKFSLGSLCTTGSQSGKTLLKPIDENSLITESKQPVDDDASSRISFAFPEDQDLVRRPTSSSEKLKDASAGEPIRSSSRTFSEDPEPIRQPILAALTRSRNRSIAPANKSRNKSRYKGPDSPAPSPSSPPAKPAVSAIVAKAQETLKNATLYLSEAPQYKREITVVTPIESRNESVPLSRSQSRSGKSMWWARTNSSSKESSIQLPQLQSPEVAPPRKFVETARTSRLLPPKVNSTKGEVDSRRFAAVLGRVFVKDALDVRRAAKPLVSSSSDTYVSPAIGARNPLMESRHQLKQASTEIVPVANVLREVLGMK